MMKEYTKNHARFGKTLRYTTCMSRTPAPAGSTSEKIGYFGGTFDPPHIGHLILAGEAAVQFNLTRLLWVITPDPPHKQDQTLAPLPHRIEMLKRMIVDNPLFEISDLEMNRPGPHYTIDTVRLLAKQEPNADIILLLGGDSLRDLPTWRLNADLVTAVSKIGVMRRPGDFADLSALEEKLPGIKEKIMFIDALLQPVSSRELRRRIAAGEMVRYYVPPSVYEYIETHHLYRGN